MRTPGMRFIALILLTFSFSTSAIYAQNNALYFDGNNDYLRVPSNPSLGFAGSFTIEAWIYADNLLPGAWKPFIARDHWFANDGFIFMRVNNLVGFLNVTGPFIATPITANTWIHMACTYDGTTLRLYKDGVEVGSSVATFTNASTDLFIGTRNINSGTGPHLGNDYWNGAIDEVRFWDVALDEATIQTQMSCGLTGNEAGLKLYYDLNQGIPGGANGGENIALDKGPNGQNASLNWFLLNGSTSNWIAGNPGIVSCFSQPIPTVSEWGLIFLFLNLLIAGNVFLYRRKNKRLVLESTELQ